MNKKLPLKCPSCDSQLSVKQLYCETCETKVTGLYTLPILAQLEPDDQAFILDFVKASGSMKIMEQKMNLSYPTVRNLLDEIIARINKLQSNDNRNLKKADGILSSG
jgi:hypothetical protein